MSSADRRDRVRETLPDDVQALLVTSPANVRYLTGFTGSNGQLLLAAEPVFFTDGRYHEQSAEQVPDLPREIYSGTTKYTDVLGKALADRGDHEARRRGVPHDDRVARQAARASCPASSSSRRRTSSRRSAA